jgi:hypothetical protein
MEPLLMSVTPPGHDPSTVRAAVEFACTVPLITTPELIVACTGALSFHPALTASVRRFASFRLPAIAKAKTFAFP